MAVSWIGHALGLDGGAFYNFYSGFGQAVGSITLLGGIFTFWRHKRCHVTGCHRLGRMKVYDSEWTVCPKHHPSGEATPEKIDQHHRARLADHGDRYGDSTS